MSAGRLVFPALRWKEESGFSHERGPIERALADGAGGFILFGGTPEGVGELTDRLVREAGRRLLFASDLERGAGQQVRGLSELPPPRALASLHDPAVLRGAGILTAVEALSVGINWVLAPVADLDGEPDNPIVQTRAFGEEPEAVAAAVTAWIVGCEAAGAMACAKHFPGHGRTRTDSHMGLPVVDAPADRLEADLLPFQAAVGAGVGSVMTAHVAYPALDPSRTPATFSRPILDILRQRFGFNGLIVSDALMMEGAREGRSQGEIGLDALRAGVDLLLYPDEPNVVAAALTAAAQRDGGIARRIEESLARYEIALQAAASEPRPERPPPSGGAQATSDWLLSGPLLRGIAPRLRPPLELVIVDDDLGTPWPVSPTSWVADALSACGVPLGAGGSRV
ncbi:MAG TPA: glycoside hydrolase family 3 N-terminal domain-containing protein, partial [Gemmatimonadales bacterium]|nr:glycoside hydrolase family 3 N-terminal domain-containing protein [Gemmatimonadales bacterium]